MSIPYMPFYTSRYLGDTHDLTTLEHGAYALLLFTMWDRGGSLPYDLEKLRKVTRLSRANWKKVWPAIEDYFLISGDEITQKFLAETHEVVSQKRKTLSENGKKGGRPKSLKNNRSAKAKGSDLLKQPEPEPDISPSSLRSEGVSSPPDYDLALQAYHEIGDQLESRFGKRVWPRVQQFTQSRKSAVLQRVSEVGGLPEWREALERASRSSFLAGQNDRGWTPNFDFFCQQSSFTKLREGQYDDRKPTGGGAPTSRPKSGSRGRTFEDDLRDIAEERGWASGSDPQREQQHSGRVIDLARGDDGGFRAFDHRSADGAVGDDAQSDRDGIEPEDDLAAIRQGVIKFSR